MIELFNHNTTIANNFKLVNNRVADRMHAADFLFVRDVLNHLTLISPPHRPVLVVREVQNSTSAAASTTDASKVGNAFDRLFATLESAKQETRDARGSFLFPVFLETSDVAWVNSPARINSPRSFQTYAIPPITKSDAHRELVEQYAVWNDDEFEQVWNAVGGHGGSLEAVHYQWRMRGGSLPEALQQVADTAYSSLLYAVHGGAGGEAGPGAGTDDDEPSAAGVRARQRYLSDLRAASYSLVSSGIASDALAPLFHHNILWFFADRVYPQTLLLQRAIDRYLANIHAAAPSQPTS